MRAIICIRFQASLSSGARVETVPLTATPLAVWSIQTMRFTWSHDHDYLTPRVGHDSHSGLKTVGGSRVSTVGR